ncbi:hypothetical protein C7377_1688 [Balneicella halophila]|uniref:SatD family protein n=1 Tax=Balneicella halophila TaxID=1537566 RepID=A0A7L4UNC4_BALHA|nr:hypothetical protein [Balneicella halophila]PVX50042.1 hypothetical protein C7377_1688 [Balneicella halophila]
MIAVITGDIIASRKLVNQNKWMSPLKELLSTWGESPLDWKLERGDFFQIEVVQPKEVLKKVLEIKALIKKVKPLEEQKTSSSIDVRMAIGIGEKTYTGTSISENNGSAYIHSGEKFDSLKKEDVTIGIKSPWQDFDREMNLYLKLAGLFMDKWTLSSAELVEIVLKNPDATQEVIGEQLNIKQNSVSGRWYRAHIDELLAVEKMFQKKISNFIK